MPDRTPGRVTIRSRRHGRVGWAWLLRCLGDYAIMAIPTSGDRYAEPKDYVTVGRRVALMAQELKFMGVVMMLEEGQAWENVAEAVGLRDGYGHPDTEAARVIYAEPYALWKDGNPQPWGQRGIAHAPSGAYGDADDMAARLDEWYAVRSGDAIRDEDGALVAGLRPVSDGLY